MERGENQGKIIFSKVVKAGKRTYFFDVAEERDGQLCLYIKESLKVLEDGISKFRKFSIRLYRENFENFISALQETLAYIEDSAPIITDNTLSKGFDFDTNLETDEYGL